MYQGQADKRTNGSGLSSLYFLVAGDTDGIISCIYTSSLEGSVDQDEASLATHILVPKEYPILKLEGLLISKSAPQKSESENASSRKVSTLSGLELLCQLCNQLLGFRVYADLGKSALQIVW